MNGKKDWAFGVLITICLAVSGHVLLKIEKIDETLGDRATALALLHETVEDIVENTEADLRRDRTLTKHWRIHSWTKDRITELRNAHDMAVVGWPSLDVD